MTGLAIALSLTMHGRLDSVMHLLVQHGGAMMSGTMIKEADPHSIPSLTADVRELRTSVFGIVGLAFGALYFSLVFIVWRSWRTITAQQEQLKEQTREMSRSVMALRESEQHFRVLCESAPAGIATADETGTVVGSNHNVSPETPTVGQLGRPKVAEARPRILLVDDEEYVREAVVEVLNEANFQCVTASSADDAAEALQREEFELVLLDINMPGRSGMEFLPEIRSEYPNVAGVIFSGIDSISTGVEAMRRGAYGYVTKQSTSLS